MKWNILAVALAIVALIIAGVSLAMEHKGPKGDAGIAGDPGLPGADGIDGVSPQFEWNGTMIRFMRSIRCSKLVGSEMRARKKHKHDKSLTSMLWQKLERRYLSGSRVSCSAF